MLTSIVSFKRPLKLHAHGLFIARAFKFKCTFYQSVRNLTFRLPEVAERASFHTSFILYMTQRHKSTLF